VLPSLTQQQRDLAQLDYFEAEHLLVKTARFLQVDRVQGSMGDERNVDQRAGADAALGDAGHVLNPSVLPGSAVRIADPAQEKAAPALPGRAQPWKRAVSRLGRP